jgi:hypothetical protein
MGLHYKPIIMNIYVFRRDLRIVDNKGFNEFLKVIKNTKTKNLCMFIFNPV